MVSLLYVSMQCAKFNFGAVAPLQTSVGHLCTAVRRGRGQKVGAREAGIVGIMGTRRGWMGEEDGKWELVSHLKWVFGRPADV